MKQLLKYCFKTEAHVSGQEKTIDKETVLSQIHFLSLNEK